MSTVPDWTYSIPWDRTRGELVLSVSHILTEPVCPLVSLTWETSGERIFSTHRNTIEEGIAEAIAWAEKNIEFKVPK